MSKFRRSINPHLAGFLHIDLVVMVTCSVSLALVISLQSPDALVVAIDAVPTVALVEHHQSPDLTSGATPPAGVALESVPGFSLADRLLLP